MSSELPDLDEDVSFVVDHGESTGPTTLRLIIDSIREGERLRSALVWWAGATDWVHFEDRDDLMALLEGHEAAEADHEEPTAPTELAVAEPVQPEMVEEIDPATEAEHSSMHAEVEPEAEIAADQPVVVDDPSPFVVEIAGFGSPDEGTAVGEDPEEPATAAAEHDPRVDHPSYRWGASAAGPSVDDQLAQVDAPVDPDADLIPTQIAPLEAEEPVFAEPAPEPDAIWGTEVVDASADQPEADDGGSADSRTEPEEESPSSPALTGLFSAGARADAGLSAEPTPPSPDALDAILAARLSLESVGARIEALSAATRRSPAPEHESDDAEPAAEMAESSGAPSVEAVAPSPDTSAVGSWQSVGEMREVNIEPAPVEAPIEAPSSIDELMDRFDEMVRKSAAHQRRIEWIMRVDELLLSTCITAIADSGFTATDLDSTDSAHRILFDHNDDSRHVRLELAPLDAVSDHLGRHVRFGLSWGRDVADIEAAIATVDEQWSADTLQPGEVMCAVDESNTSVSTRVELIWAADDFVKADYSVDRASLDASIAAALHALEKRWRELFTAL